MEKERDHLFISYAWEDAALAEWLARKLMAMGFGIWIDRFKNLGGDIWPENIDNAIKHRSYRMLHLLSKSSLNKENPSKERQLALALGKERNEQFLIPLNVDDLSPEELPWQLTDIQYIGFMDWAEGLSKLRETLYEQNCPRVFEQKGPDLAIRSCLPVNAINDEFEVLHSNCYEVLQIPEVVQRYECKVPFTRLDVKRVSKTDWPCFRVSDSWVLSFQPPPASLMQKHRFARKGGSCWQICEDVDGVKSGTIVKNLLRKSLSCIFANKGLVTCQRGYWHFPQPDNITVKWLNFKCYTGRRSRVKAWGVRTIRGEEVRYALGCKVVIRDDILPEYTFQVKLRLHLTNPDGNELDQRRIPSRRKAIARNWWNHEWLLRQEAIMWFLAEGAESFSWGNTDETKVVFSSRPVSGQVPSSLDDAYIDSVTRLDVSETAIKEDILDETFEEANHPPK